MMQVKQISDNEIYLLIKYIKSVLWRVAKCLSYIEQARCLKVKDREGGETLRCVTSACQSRMACLSDVPCYLPGVMEKSDEKHPSGNQFPDRDLKAKNP